MVLVRQGQEARTTNLVVRTENSYSGKKMFLVLEKLKESYFFFSFAQVVSFLSFGSFNLVVDNDEPYYGYGGMRHELLSW